MFDTNPKSFSNDLKKIINKLKNKEKFAFSKYADGELHIIVNKPVNNGEFWFIPEQNQFNRAKMIDSFKYRHDNYYIGICCPCCGSWGVTHPWMKKQSGQKPENITWANIFVNSNHKKYLEEMVPLYKNYDVYLVSNDASNLASLPFEVKGHFSIGKNAWVDNYNVVDQIKSFIDDKEVKNSLFLFCAGPFGNILTHQLFEHNKDNTYIDIGSTLNPFLLGERGKNRDYLKGGADLNKTCIWGNE